MERNRLDLFDWNKEGKVDFNMINDIRQALRRSYVYRTDFKRIFNNWNKRNIRTVSS